VTDGLRELGAALFPAGDGGRRVHPALAWTALALVASVASPRPVRAATPAPDPTLEG